MATDSELLDDLSRMPDTIAVIVGSELVERLREYSYKSACMAHWHTQNHAHDDAEYWSRHAQDMLTAADRLAALGDVEKDAARYRAMFSDGEWDYSDLWIGEQKSVVDAHIDRGLQPHEPEDD